MNKVSAILSLAALLLAVSSCDFFRCIAGRPGSAELQQKRERIEKMEVRRDSVERARIDSVIMAEKAAADSLYAVDTLTRRGLLRKASAVKRISASQLANRYYIVAGAFSKPANADRLAQRYADAGVESLVFRYTSGLCGVFVAPSDRVAEALVSYRKVMQLPFASHQAWILVNE